ncbi:MAG: ribonuclease P protein component, partial [Phycisphaerales bacterium]
MSSQPKANGSRLGRNMRLTRAGQFQLVFGANVRTAVGPLLVWALPNELGHPRLGFAISRRVGTAVARN